MFIVKTSRPSSVEKSSLSSRARHGMKDTKALIKLLCNYASERIIDGGLAPGAPGSEDRRLRPRRGWKHDPDRLHPSSASPQALRGLPPRTRRG